MTDQEIIELQTMNANRYEAEKNALYEQYLKMDDFIREGFKKNAVHRHFKTNKAMREAMARDYNPFNSFSYGRKTPTNVST